MFLLIAFFHVCLSSYSQNASYLCSEITKRLDSLNSLDLVTLMSRALLSVTSSLVLDPGLGHPDRCRYNAMLKWRCEAVDIF